MDGGEEVAGGLVVAAGRRRELLEAMRAIAATGEAPLEQVPSIGCTIKWKAAA